MTYIFRGFFADSDETLLRQTQIEWPGILARTIEDPFKGIGVGILGDESEAQEELAQKIERELPEFSRSWSNYTFVFVYADCWGGICQYSGYVCRSGEIICQEPADADETGPEPLKRMLKPLGVSLDNKGFFAPFRRGYFDGPTSTRETKKENDEALEWWTNIRDKPMMKPWWAEDISKIWSRILNNFRKNP